MSVMKIGFLGLTFTDPNKGCEALTYTFLNMLQEFYQGKQLEIVCFMRSDDLGKIPEVYPDFKFRCHILNIYNPLSWLSVYKEIKECTCVFDGSYGDGFTGIYGTRRNFVQCLRKQMVISAKKPLYLLPQTYGSYKFPFRKWSVDLIRKAALAYARDEKTAKEVGDFVKVTSDMAFGLPYDKAAYSFDAKKKFGINVYNVQQVGIGKSLVNKGYNYDFITFKKNAPRKETVFYEKDGCRAKCIELPRIRVLRWGINTDICKKEFLDKYDLIICQEYYQLETYLISCKSNRVAMYTGPYYNMFLPKCFSPIYDFLFTKRINRQIKHKFVKSVLAYDFMEKKGYTGLTNVGVALDTSRFVDVEILPETKQLIDFMKTNKCLLYVGSLIERKNYPFLLETYKKMLQRDPDVKLVLIGKSKVSGVEKYLGKKDSEYAAKYDKNLTEKEKAGIYHLERLANPQLRYIYPLAKAFLLPSIQEIFGMVLLEAMYFGAPVVSSRNGGSLTLMADGKCGQIVDEFDAEKWCDAISKYLDDPQYAKSVVEAAMNKVKEEYTWDVITQKMLEISGI